jgi:hypothetical protein
MDEEMQNIKNKYHGGGRIFNKVCLAFEKLFGKDPTIHHDIDGVAVLVEDNFKKNLKNLIGVDCE